MVIGIGKTITRSTLAGLQDNKSRIAEVSSEEGLSPWPFLFISFLVFSLWRQEL